MGTELQELLRRFDGVKRCGNNGQYMARCPCHDDRKQSLSVGLGKKGVVLKCQAGCDTRDILARVGLTSRDLFYNAAPANEGNRPQITAIYNYPNGVQKLRKSDKSFSWRRPDGKGGWLYNRKGVPHCLYVAGRLSDAVAVAEGEKDADSLHRLGWDAVSGEDGAGPGKWRKEYTDQLKGCDVCIFQDNDEVGRAYAQETAAALYGVARSVQVLDLSAAWSDIPEHGDISDMIDCLGDKRTSELIEQLVGNTPAWEPEQTTSMSLSLICAADVEYTPPKWLIAPYFQRGKGTLIQADPGTGKTAFMCAIAASVTTGNPILGLAVQTPGSIVMLSVEDDLGVLRGRISASGGNPNKVFFFPNPAELTLNSPEIEQAVKQVGAKLLIFDPLQAFLGAGIDMFRANETRPALARLFEMCERNDCACAIIAHMGKSLMGKSPVNQSLGSVDIPAAMRSVLHIAKNPDDENERIAVHVKSSNAPKGQSIAYEIVDRGGVEWHRLCDFTAEDLNAVRKRTEKGIPYENDPMVQVFNQLIADRPGGGFWSYDEIRSVAMKLVGFPPFSSPKELRSRLEGSLSRELQTKDGLIVTCGHKQHGSRGIRIEQYRHPEGYQTRI